jgi:hypothetical protein
VIFLIDGEKDVKIIGMSFMFIMMGSLDKNGDGVNHIDRWKGSSILT